jgi:hypothetical protein
MKLALLLGSYLAIVTILCVGFATDNSLYVVDALLSISVTALFIALILVVWQDFHPRR